MCTSFNRSICSTYQSYSHNFKTLIINGIYVYKLVGFSPNILEVLTGIYWWNTNMILPMWMLYNYPDARYELRVLHPSRWKAGLRISEWLKQCFKTVGNYSTCRNSEPCWFSLAFIPSPWLHTVAGSMHHLSRHSWIPVMTTWKRMTVGPTNHGLNLLPELQRKSPTLHRKGRKPYQMTWKR